MAEKNVMDVLRERGFIAQTVYEEELYKMLGEEKVTFYVGFDPTADSLHIGHYIPIMAVPPPIRAMGLLPACCRRFIRHRAMK